MITGPPRSRRSLDPMPDADAKDGTRSPMLLVGASLLIAGLFARFGRGLGIEFSLDDLLAGGRRLLWAGGSYIGLNFGAGIVLGFLLGWGTPEVPGRRVRRALRPRSGDPLAAPLGQVARGGPADSQTSVPRASPGPDHRGLRLDEAATNRVAGELHAIAHPELLQHVLTVSLHGPDADHRLGAVARLGDHHERSRARRLARLRS